jgi:hypothetical protein
MGCVAMLFAFENTYSVPDAAWQVESVLDIKLICRLLNDCKDFISIYDK